jgi:predicted ATPase
VSPSSRVRSRAGTLALVVTLLGERPLIIAVDDLQWLDRSSAQVLGFGFRRLSTGPIGLLATVRNDPAAPALPERDDVPAIGACSDCTSAR